MESDNDGWESDSDGQKVTVMDGKRPQQGKGCKEDVAGRNVGFSEPKRQFHQLEHLYSDPNGK